MNTINKRLFSLDAFRGLCMLGMLLVDYPGDWGNKYSQLVHASWNGFTLADLIFPSFVFIVGVAIMFSLAKRVERGDSHKSIMLQVLKRAAILILLGLISNAVIESQPIYSLKTLRILGVLQRIAIVYVIASFLYLKVGINKLAWIGGGLLFLYWGIMTIIPVPGFGKPDLSIHPSESVANLSAWLDSVVLGNHVSIWSKPFDNEGILSTIPVISTIILGMLTGWLVKSGIKNATKVYAMLISGAALIAVGYIWGIFFPINKLLWTSSFVLYTGGMSVIIFAVFYWLIDLKGYQLWSRPLQVLGKNAILVFTAALCFQGAYWRILVTHQGEETAFRWFLYTKFIQPISDNPYFTSLIYSLIVILFWYGVSVFLDKKKIYLRA